ncbi:MAG: ester cyclase, partial [Terriglobia bacterium]
MSLEANKALACRYFEEFLNQGNLCVADEILDTNVSYCGSFLTIDGVDRLKRFFLMVRKAFPDLHYVVEEGIAEGDKVVNCFSSRGTCLRGFEGTEFHGRQFSVPGVNVFCIRNGKIAEVRCFWDTYSQMQQLNWIPLAAVN